MSTQPSIDLVWNRIKGLAGKEFETKTGMPFTYALSGNVLYPSRTDYGLSWGEFAKALELWPVKAPGEISRLVRGPSYIWAILNDPRVTGQGLAAATSPKAQAQKTDEDLAISAGRGVSVAPTVEGHGQVEVMPLKSARSEPASSARIGLVGCVKTKLDHAAPAADLYVSPLFRGRRDYVERTCERWFILSALHGVICPKALTEPYDVTLNNAPRAERRAWAAKVLSQLDAELGSYSGLTLEIHAGANYTDFGLVGGLRGRGATVEQPAAGLSVGRQLAFYAAHRREAAGTGSPSGDTVMDVDADGLSGVAPSASASIDAPRVAPLWQERDAWSALADLEESPTLVPARDWPAGLTCLDQPGLYGWWVDEAGAADLSRGLGLTVASGRIYAGQAGATKWPSGRAGDNSLGKRIGQMHLGGRVRMSTFRWTLAAILFERLDVQVQAGMLITLASEQALTEWMCEHLAIAVHAHTDRDTLAGLEHALLQRLDPPLNLSHMPPTPVRARLTELRRRISREG